MRGTYTLALVLAAAALALSACQDQTRGDATTVRLAVTDLQGLEELQREFGTFKAELERATGLSIEFYAVADRAAAAAALKANQVDLVFTGPAEYVVMRARTGAVPVVAIRRPEYRACIYTRADSGITGVADLRGKVIGMSDVGSTSGHLAPSQLLLDAGLEPGTDVTVIPVGNAVHEALKRGDVAAVGIGCHNYERYTNADEPGLYALVTQGPALPPDVMVAHPELSQATVQLIQSAFRDNWQVLLDAILVGEDNQKYRQAELVIPTDADYDVVRSMYRAIGVNDFTDFVGD